ncbi:MAG: hypothetical protein WC843_00305 [Candidatus Gracilibacteria bacterium]|jgi:hypothetical protein
MSDVESNKEHPRKAEVAKKSDLHVESGLAKVFFARIKRLLKFDWLTEKGSWWNDKNPSKGSSPEDGRDKSKNAKDPWQ